MENKFNITVTGDQKEPVQIVIREGAAAELIKPLKVDFSGTIESARLYASKIIDKEKAVVTFSLDNKTIELVSDPTDIYRHKIVGTMKDNPEFVAFGINKDKKFGHNALTKFIKSNAHCFKSIQDAKDLVKSLQNFVIKFEKEHTKTDNRQGETEDSVKQSIGFSKGELPKKIDLLMPLYTGTDPVPFSLEIEIDSDGTAPVFSFYSLDVEVLLKETVEVTINGELKSLRNDFTCIQLN